MDIEMAEDMASQDLVDFIVARNRLHFPGGRIAINVVTPTVANQDTASRQQQALQFTALHTTTGLV